MAQNKEHKSPMESFHYAFRREWKAITKDKAVLSSFISMTILILVVYSIVFSREVVYEVPTAVIDQDYTRSSRDFIAMVDASPGIKVVKDYTDLAGAQRAMYSGDVKGIFVIPKRFDQDLRTNRQPAVSVYADASNMIFYKTVYGTVATVQAYFNGNIKVKRAIASGSSLSSVSPLNTITTNLFNPSGGYGTYLIPTITVLVLQLVILLAIGIFAGTDYEQNNSKKGKLAKRQTIPMLLGRAGTYLSIVAVMLPIQFGLIFYLFTFPLRTSLFSIYIFMFPYVVALVFMGILISSLFKRREDAILVFSVLVIPAMMMSGLSYPEEGLNPIFNYLGELLPSTSGARGMLKLTQFGAPFNEVYPEWIKLWGLALFYFALTVILNRLPETSSGQALQRRG